jgi:hypothetical protein
MDKHIGEIGEIVSIDNVDSVDVKISFDEHIYYYPLSEVHKHLVLEDEAKLPYIPEKYEEALFWVDDEEKAEIREFLCYDNKARDYPFITKNSEENYGFFKNCKPLPKEEPKKEKFLWQIQDSLGGWFLHNYYLTEDEIDVYTGGVHKSYRKVESIEQLLKILE